MRCNFYLLMGYVILHKYKVISDMECFHKLGEKKIVNCISSDDLRSEVTLSVDKISGDEDTEELSIDLGDRLVWEIDVWKFDFFSHLKNLSTLIIKSKFEIAYRQPRDPRSGEFESAKRTFIDRLFYISKLQHLEVHSCQFTDEYNWTLPKSLRYLAFPNSSYTKFDLRNQPILAFVNFENNNLTRMPKFSSVPPPITGLNLNDNNFLEIAVDDVASLCHLKNLSLNKFNEHLSDPVKNCRCVQLKEWMKLHDISAALNDNECEHPSSKCSEIAMIKANKKYKKCVELTHEKVIEHEETTKSSAKGDPLDASLEWYQYWYSWLLIIIMILSILFVLFLFYGVVTFIVQAQNDNMLDSDPARIYDPYITEELEDGSI